MMLSVGVESLEVVVRNGRQISRNTVCLKHSMVGSLDRLAKSRFDRALPGSH